MSNTENECLKLCIRRIEDKLRWGESAGWKQRDFEYLSRLIFKETRVMLSLSTLKRIWRKKSGIPHPSTLDALAHFIGYEGWIEFKQSLPEVDPILENRVRSRTKKMWKWPAAAIVLLSVVLIFLFVFRSCKKDSNEHVSFSSRKTITSGVPNTVIFDYDIGSVHTDNVTIQQSWDTRQQVRLSRDGNTHTSVYYYPGFHIAKLLVDGRIVDEQRVHITTDGWLGLVRYSLDDPVPVYLSKERMIKDGVLYASPELLKENNVDLSQREYYVSYYNVREFGKLSGDDFQLETRVSSSLKEGGLTCQLFDLIILNENGRMIVPLSAQGCISLIRLKLMEKTILGKDADLSLFGCDMSQWNELAIEVRDRHATISLNGKAIYVSEYQQPAGLILGIHLMFYGSGKVDKILMYDASRSLFYTEDFR